MGASPVRILVSKGIADHEAFTKLATGYKLTPQHRIDAAKQVKVVAINTRKARAAEYAGVEQIVPLDDVLALEEGIHEETAA